MEQAQFEHYRMGIYKLLSLMGKEHARLGEVRVLQHHLMENLRQTMADGTTPSLHAARMRILESCNRLSQEVLGTSFYDLCEIQRPPLTQDSDAEAVVRDRQHQKILDAYFVEIQHLLDAQGLRTAGVSSQVRENARRITLDILQRMQGDCVRKGQIVHFLYESGLITEGPGVIFLADADLSQVYLEDASLIEAHLAGTDLSGARLARAHLEWVRFGEANLIAADLSSAHLVAAHLVGVNLAHAKLEAAHLIGANLAGANLTGAQLNGAHLEWAFMVTANLEAAQLRDARLNGAEMMWARLPRADLAGADLTGANLEQAHLVWARFKGARYDARTRWPTGFDPVAAQAIEVDSR